MALIMRINVCNGGVRDVFVLEYGCVRHLLSVGILDLADIFTVVVRGGVEVPAIDFVIVPGGACVWLLMYGYGASHRAKGYSVVVKGSEHRCIG